MVRPPAAAVWGMTRTEVLELVEADAREDGAGVWVDGEAMVYGGNDDHNDTTVL